MAQYILLALLVLLIILVAVYWRKFQAMGLAIQKFLREVRVEMQKVSWPSKNDIIGSVIVVLVAVVAITVIVGITDEVLSKISIPVIAQEYVAGVEYGVFWYRVGGQEHGEVFSVSHKEPVAVLGDGEKTLEDLLLAHHRVLPLLDYHLDRHASRLREVPARGERVQVTELGTHSLGATFLDSMHLKTGELEMAINRMMASCPDLDFGRFDIRAPSESEFIAGRGLRVLEFNGLSAEAAHAYDPANPVSTGRGILLEQWTLALQVGALRAQSGVRRSGWWEIWRALRAHSADRGQRGG